MLGTEEGSYFDNWYNTRGLTVLISIPLHDWEQDALAVDFLEGPSHERREFW